MFAKKQYELMARLLGASQNLTDFEERLISAFRNEREEFDEERFRKAVKRFRQLWNPV